MTISDSLHTENVVQVAVADSLQQGAQQAVTIFQLSKEVHQQLPVGEMKEDGISSDTVIVPVALRPVVHGAQREERIDSALRRDIWWNAELDKFSERAEENYGEHWEECVLLPEDGREAGDLLPYRVTTDDYVVSVLMVCFFVAAFFVARSQHFFMLKAKDFFRTSGRENLFNDSSDERMTGKFFFPFVLSCGLSVLMFDYQRIYYPDMVREVSPYIVIGINLAAFGAGYLLRTLLYKFVNSVFFDRDQYTRWIESYHLLTIAASLLIFPISLLVVFYELDFSNWRFLFYVSVIFVEIFLIFKTYHIFFKGLLGVLHLILYLCTLEFLPLLTLWKGMVWVTQELTKLV